MKLQHDTHYLTKTLDVRYVVADRVSSNFWSKHSLYNPNNIENTEEVSEYGLKYCNHAVNTDIVTDVPLLLEREDKDYIVLQNFEIINYYGDSLIKTAKEVSNGFEFSSILDSKPGCIVALSSTSREYFPILALFYRKDNTLSYKLNNLIRCLQWK